MRVIMNSCRELMRTSAAFPFNRARLGTEDVGAQAFAGDLVSGCTSDARSHHGARPLVPLRNHVERLRAETCIDRNPGQHGAARRAVPPFFSQ